MSIENVECLHEGETIFMTNAKHVCKKCGKIYYHDETPVDWDKLNKKEEENGKNNSETTKS